MRSAFLLSGLVVLLAGCDSTATSSGASPTRGELMQGESRWIYGIDPGEVDCTYGSRRPGNVVCGFDRDGRELTAEVSIEETPLGAETDLPVGDRQFWQTLITDMERQAQATTEPGVTRLQAQIQGSPKPPIVDADACVRFSVEYRQGETFIDNEGVRCAFFDPDTFIVDFVLVEYVERRTGRSRSPSFSREADAVIATLNQAPKTGTN